MYLLGIDIGTSGAKAALFQTSGEMIAKAYEAYPILYPEKGALELNPIQVFNAVLFCLSELAKHEDVSKVIALAISTQGEAIIPVDKYGNSMMNAVLTFDSRNEKEFEWFSTVTDRTDIMKRTGMPSHPMFSVTKILWIKNNFPEIYENTWKFMCFGDFVAYKLGAIPTIDYSMAARTMLFNLKTNDWDREILELCNITENKLPKLVPTGTIIGTAGTVLTTIGYPTELKIIAGGHDQLCCCLGAGVLHDGVAMDSLGTTESIVCVSEKLVQTQGMLESNIPVYPYPVNSMYAYMTFLTCCASLVKWFKENIQASYDETFYREYDNYIIEHGCMPAQLYVLPYFAGAGTPSMNFHAKGAIVGLTLDTNRYQIYQAILEGTCFEERINLLNMERCGIGINELRCIGGGANSALWLQMKANITGKKVVSMQCSEAGCLGAAILAGLGSGSICNINEAEKNFIKIKATYLPNPEMEIIYTSLREKYEKLSVNMGDFYEGCCC